MKLEVSDAVPKVLSVTTSVLVQVPPQSFVAMSVQPPSSTVMSQMASKASSPVA